MYLQMYIARLLTSIIFILKMYLCVYLSKHICEYFSTDGFRKVVHVEQGGLKVEIDDLEFQHAYFQRGQIELLDLIKRKVKQVKCLSVHLHIVSLSAYLIILLQTLSHFSWLIND